MCHLFLYFQVSYLFYHQNKFPVTAFCQFFEDDNEQELHIDSDSDDNIENDEDKEYENISVYHQKRMRPTLSETPAVTPTPKQMRVPLPNLALVCDRAGVSDRSAAIIASSVLQDFGIV
uniref:Uncharacterized protein n=1 Tax=Cacopsylla melanoneura TaxID=428564 RepID=A0A8D8T5D6_9HEMI